MKIAIDISQIVYKGSGVGRYTEDLVHSLLRYDQTNEYILFGSTIRQNEVFNSFILTLKNYNNVTWKHIFLPITFLNILWNRFHVINLETFLGPIDVLHSSDWIQPPTRAKKVTTVHDMIVYKFPETSHQYIIDTQKRRLQWVKKECDVIIADSKATKDDLCTKLEVEESRIVVIYPGINLSFRPQSKDEVDRVKRKYSLFGDYILTVGIQEPRKNLKSIFSAFEILLNKTSRNSKAKLVNLVVVGKKGWGSELKLSQSIRYLNYIDSKDLPPLYSGAICFVYPSIYEGFGLPVLEAMACGCPVITSDRGSLIEIAGDSALFANPLKASDIAEKVDQIFTDDDLRKSLIKKGKVNALKFSWQKTAEQVLDLYNKINLE